MRSHLCLPSSHSAFLSQPLTAAAERRDHGVDGLICSPTLGTATARFLGIPAFPVCRLIFAAFFGCHVIEAATGKLNMGAAFYGADEASLQVLFQLILEAAGYTNVLSTVLGVAEPEPAAAFVIRPVLAIVLCVWQFYWLFVQETKQGKINFTKLMVTPSAASFLRREWRLTPGCLRRQIWLPFYLLIFFIPPEYGAQGESEYTGALPLVLYGCFAPPLCVLLLANSGLLRGKDEKAA